MALIMQPALPCLLPHADAMLVGFLNTTTGYCKLNPPPERVLQPGDSILMMRGGPAAYCAQATPLATPVEVDMGERSTRSRPWSPNLLSARTAAHALQCPALPACMLRSSLA